MRARILGTVAALAIMAGAAAQEGPGWHHHMEGMEILHGLNLTGPQKSQVHEIIAGAMSQAQPIREKMHALHEQMAGQLLASGDVTAAQLAPLVQQAEALRTQLDQIHVDTMVKIRALLTPEQVTQAADLHQKLESLHAQEHALTQDDDGD